MKSRNKRLYYFIAVFLISITVIGYWSPIAKAVISTETRNFLNGDAGFEGNSYNSWGTYSLNMDDITKTSSMQFSQDNTIKHGGTSSAMYSMLTVKGTSADTGWYEYSFTTPENYSSSSLSLWYRADLTGTSFNWEILNKSTGASVVTGTAWTQGTVNTWFQKSIASISGLASNTAYLLRIKSTITATSNTTPNKAWIDDVVLNITWGDNSPPVVQKLDPSTSVTLQKVVNLSATVTDPAGVKSATFEYSPAGANTWTTIGTINTVYTPTGTYTTSWDTSSLAEGNYDVRVTATDNTTDPAKAHTSIPYKVTYKVDSHGPQISNLSPTNNSVVSGYTQSLGASVSDFSYVKEVQWEYWDSNANEWVAVETAKPTTPTTSGLFSVIWHTNNVHDGTYTLRIKGTDRSKLHLATDSPPTITYIVNNLAPVLKNVTPENWSAIRGAGMNLSVDVPNVEDGNPIAMVKWEYSDDGGTTWKLIGTSSTPSGTNKTYSVPWNTSGLPDGSYKVRISAIDSTPTQKAGVYEALYYIDNTVPTLNRAEVITKDLLTVYFNEADINSTTATNPANYTIYETANLAKTLSVIQAVGKTDGTGIKLTTSAQTPNVNYTVKINAVVADRAGNLLSGPTTVNFNGSSEVKGNPHGGYSTSESWCNKCHLSHTSTGTELTTNASEKLLCYTCHDDSGLSVYDVRKEFGSVGIAGAVTSHHPVPEDQQKCSSCHEPHLVVAANPFLVEVKDTNNHTYNSGNNTCWACHGDFTTHGSVVNITGIPGVDDHEKYYNLTPGLDGSKQGAHADITNPLLKPPTAAQISCSVCHEPHGSDHTKLMKHKVNNTVVDGDDNSQCFACHINNKGSFLGQAVWEDTTYSAHSRRDSGALYPGGLYGPDRSLTPGDRGKCVNCHNMHGTPYGKALLDQYTVPAYNDTDALKNYDACLKHHGPSGIANRNVRQYYVNTYSGTGTYGGTEGHFIKSSNRYKDSSGNSLVVGWKIPCFDCHDTHGSTGQNRFLLRGDIEVSAGEPLLTHLFKGTTKSARDFCTQCHHTYDDTGPDHNYRGSTIPKLPSTNLQHAASSTTNPNPLECNFCHGGGDLVKGAHSPNSGRSEGGLECGLCHTKLANMTGASSNNFKHYMSDEEADQLPSKYDASVITATSTTCLSTCHVDHDQFNPDPIGAKKFLRATGGNTTSTPLRISPLTSASLDVTQQNGLCLSVACHAKAGGLDNPDYLSPSGFESTTDVKAQADSTGGRHPITQNAKGTAAIANNLNSSWVTSSGWNNRSPKRLACTDCHYQNAEPGGTFNDMTRGPHGQANLYMLKGTSLGNTNNISGGTFQTYDTFCITCHSQTTYGGNGSVGSSSSTSAAVASHSKGQHYYFSASNGYYNPYGCLGCHGGNLPDNNRGTNVKARGSIHGNSQSGMLNGNLVSNWDGNYCTARVGDPSAAKCSMNAHQR